MSRFLPDSSKIKKAAASSAMLGGLSYLSSLLGLENSDAKALGEVGDKLKEEFETVEDKVSLLLAELMELAEIVADEAKSLAMTNQAHSIAAVASVEQAKAKLEIVAAALKDQHPIADKDLARAVKEAKKAIVDAKKFLLKTEHTNHL